MADESTRTVLVALGTGLGVAIAKAGAAAFTGLSALAAEAAHALADTANDSFLFVAQRCSPRASWSDGRSARFTQPFDADDEERIAPSCWGSQGSARSRSSW